MCPYCNWKISFSETPKLGQQVTCLNCGERLEVSNLNPVELDYKYNDDYEYEYADDYEYNGDYSYADDDGYADDDEYTDTW